MWIYSNIRGLINVSNQSWMNKPELKVQVLVITNPIKTKYADK
jgi:hypothetical protein